MSVQSLLERFSLQSNPFIVLDIAIVSILFYYAFVLVKETRAIRIVYGISLLALVYLVGQAFDLTLVKFIFRGLGTILLLSIPVIFQPEIRSALERLGRTRFIGDFSRLRRQDVEYVIHELVFAADMLSRAKTGALIVIARATGLRDYTESGMELNAHLSAQLLLSLFQRQSPLHDGAVVVIGNRIAAASVVLPLSDSKFDSELGTRHRAALGLSSQTDAIIVVVSEQKGTISVALGGELTKYDPTGLERFLKREFRTQLIGGK